MSEGKEKAVVEIVDLTDMDEDNGKDVQGLYPIPFANLKHLCHHRTSELSHDAVLYLGCTN